MSVTFHDSIDLSKVRISKLTSGQGGGKFAFVSYGGQRSLEVQTGPMYISMYCSHFDDAVKYKLNLEFKDRGALTPRQVRNNQEFNHSLRGLDDLIVEEAGKQQWIKGYDAVKLRQAEKYYHQLKSSQDWPDKLVAVIKDQGDGSFVSDNNGTPLLVFDKDKHLVSFTPENCMQQLPYSTIGRVRMHLTCITLHTGKISVKWTVQQIQILKTGAATQPRIENFALAEREGDEGVDEIADDDDTTPDHVNDDSGDESEEVDALPTV